MLQKEDHRFLQHGPRVLNILQVELQNFSQVLLVICRMLVCIPVTKENEPFFLKECTIDWSFLRRHFASTGNDTFCRRAQRCEYRDWHNALRSLFSVIFLEALDHIMLVGSNKLGAKNVLRDCLDN
jgi:hypothetical protein